MPRPLILFATIAAGGSHVSSAQAMVQAVEAHYPGVYELELSDLMKDMGFHRFDALHKRSWRRALENPWTVTWGKRLIDNVPRLSVATNRLLLRRFARDAATTLRERPPKLIVVNHGWLTTALTLSQRRFGLDVPVLTFQTSTLDATALWAEPHAERFVLGSPIAKEMLVRLGVSPDKIDVVGYPVKQAFLHAPSKGCARERLGLKDLFTCFISIGGEGVGGQPLQLVRAIKSLAFPIQIVVIAGRNAALKGELDALAARDPLLRAEGFVDNMADFVAASDVVIGKTGPATVFESLAVGRPILAPERVGGAEDNLITFLEAKALGHYVPTMELLKGTLRNYYAHPEQLEEVKRRSRAFDFPDMTRRIAHYIVHYAETGRANLQLLGSGIR